MQIPRIIASVAARKLPKSMLKIPPGFKPAKVSEFKEDMQRLGEDIAQEFMETVVDNIENNTYGYRLNQATIDRKGSDIPLIDTHEMVDSIYRDETTVSVEDTPRSDSPLTNKELAIVQEYGTKDKNIPPRPVWRQTFKDFKPIARKRIEEFLDTHKFNGEDNG